MVTFGSIDPDRVPVMKMTLHAVQILFVFVIWCLEISVFVNAGARINGQNGWTFGVCFLTIPAWIYLIMTPRWDRSRHLADPRAMLAVDAIFAIIWLSAFASQAAYNTANLCGGACGPSKAIVGLGVLTTITWVLSTLLSFYTFQYWNTSGTLPGYDQRKLSSGGADVDPDKAAFSMAPHDEEAYAPVHMDERDPGAGDEYASGAYGGAPYAGGRYDEDDVPDRFGAHSARPNPLFAGDTSYGGPSHHTPGRTPSPAVNPYAPPVPGPSHHTPGRTPSPAVNPYAPPVPGPTGNPFDDTDPVQFPAGNYDRGL